MFFLMGIVKLMVIAGIFFAVSRLSKNGVLYFIQGLMMIYLGIAGAGIRQLLKNTPHGT